MHGGMGDCGSWERQLDAFAQDHGPWHTAEGCTAPHNPMAAVHPSLDQEGADLGGLLAALRTGPAHLIATSYGAMVALAFALPHPHRVRSLVLVEPPLHYWVCVTSRGRRLFRQFIERCWTPARVAFNAGRDEEAVRLLTDGMWGRPVYDELPAARHEMALRNARAMKLLVAGGEPLPDLPRDAVAALTMPVLLVHGGSTSELHRRGVDELATVLPNPRRTVIESAGHAWLPKIPRRSMRPCRRVPSGAGSRVRGDPAWFHVRQALAPSVGSRPRAATRDGPLASRSMFHGQPERIKGVQRFYSKLDE